jgi:hypothetical protein
MPDYAVPAAMENKPDFTGSPTHQLASQLVVQTPSSGLRRIRFGNSGDGGYVLLDAGLDQVEAFYSYGISDDYSFDLGFGAATGARGRLYDPTVDYPPEIAPGLSFYKTGLACNQGTISDHIESNGDGGKRMVLKVDTEGHEWIWLKETTREELCQFDQIVIELHGLCSESRHQEFAKSLEKLNRSFSLFHVHANNLSGLHEIQGCLIPDLLECSFVRRDICECRANTTVILPIPGIDFCSIESYADWPLDYWPFISGQPAETEIRARESVLRQAINHQEITRLRRALKHATFELDCHNKSAASRLAALLRNALPKARNAGVQTS